MFTIRNYLADVRRLPDENIAARDRLTLSVRLNCEKRLPPALPGEITALIDFVCGEAKRIMAMLPDASPYKAADILCTYADDLSDLLMLFIETPKLLPRRRCDLITSLWNMVDEKRVLERAIDEMFDRSEETEVITEYDLSIVLDMLPPITDQYRRNNFALELLHYANKLPRLTLDAEMRLQEFVAGEMTRLRYIGDSMAQDEADGLEYLADLCRNILNDRLTEILTVLPKLHRPHISSYVLTTLLSGGKALPEGLVSELAHDEEYAAACKCALEAVHKGDLFPADCNDRLKLCRSAMIHWLTYSSELGCKPDAIQPLCPVELEDDFLIVFKFKSSSDLLPEDCKDRWLVGWSDGESDTFSDYEPLDRIKAKTPEKLKAYFRRKLG